MMKAHGRGRVVTFDDGTTITVAVPWWSWLFMGKRRKRDRPREVTFTVDAVASVRYSAPWLLFAGRVLLDVPSANDPWGRARMKKGRVVKLPRPRPHRIRFGYLRRREWALLVAGMHLVRSDLLPTAARWRSIRALGFRGGLSAPETPRVLERRPARVGRLVTLGRLEVQAPTNRRRRTTPR